jgi:hypothetical protein
VSRAREVAIEILLGVAVLALAIVVFVLNRDTSSDLLAVIALLGGLAIIVNVLPIGNHRNGDNRRP